MVFVTKDSAVSLFSKHEDILKALQTSENELLGLSNDIESVSDSQEHTEL